MNVHPFSYDMLDHSVPEHELPKPLPARSCDVAELSGLGASERMLAL